MNTSILTVPVSVEAKTKEELTIAMLAVQKRLKSKVHFFDISFVKGKWTAWYEVDLRSQLIRENDANTTE